MPQHRLLRSLALLAALAFVANTAFNTFYTIEEDYDDYDLILDNISRRLTVSPSRKRINQYRTLPAQKLIDRGLDPHSQRFREIMQRKMKDVQGVRNERGEDRKIRRKIEMDVDVWEGTPLKNVEKIKVSFSLRHLVLLLVRRVALFMLLVT